MKIHVSKRRRSLTWMRYSQPVFIRRRLTSLLLILLGGKDNTSPIRLSIVSWKHIYWSLHQVPAPYQSIARKRDLQIPLLISQSRQLGYFVCTGSRRTARSVQDRLDHQGTLIEEIDLLERTLILHQKDKAVHFAVSFAPEERDTLSSQSQLWRKLLRSTTQLSWCQVTGRRGGPCEHVGVRLDCRCPIPKFNLDLWMSSLLDWMETLEHLDDTLLFNQTFVHSFALPHCRSLHTAANRAQLHLCHLQSAHHTEIPTFGKGALQGTRTLYKAMQNLALPDHMFLS